MIVGTSLHGGFPRPVIAEVIEIAGKASLLSAVPRLAVTWAALMLESLLID